MTAQSLVTDLALPGLASALDCEAMSGRLPALLAMDGAGGAAGARVIAVDLLKHKVGRRCSLAYTLQAQEVRYRLFAKAFANDRGAGIALTMARLAGAIPREELLIPRPLGYLEELKLLVTEYLEGDRLATALFEGASEEPARRMAAALALLHGSAIPFARRWNPRKELRNTSSWVSGLAGRGPAASDRARRLLDELGALSRTLPKIPAEPVHRDFYESQVFDCGGRTALLDLDDARAGDPALDIGNFLAHLTLRTMQFPETARGCGRARPVFLDEYRTRRRGRIETLGLPLRIRYYEATSLLRLSGVYSARERWSEALPSRLMDACEATLACKEVPW